MDQRITYREAVSSDAEALLEFLKAVGGESDNLTFGPEGIPFSAEQEAAFLNRLAESPCSRIFLALDGDRIVGNGSVDGTANPRFRHRRNLAIAVRRDFWGRHIGTGLMERMIAFARQTGAEILSLEVRADNTRAISLYRKFGFVRIGTYKRFSRIGDEYFDADLMLCDLSEQALA